MYPFAVHARPATPGPARRRGVERNGVAKLAHQQRAGGPPPARRTSPVPCSCGRPPTVTPPALQAALPGRHGPCCVFSREYTAEIGQAVRSPAHVPRRAATTFTRDGSLTCRRSNKLATNTVVTSRVHRDRDEGAADLSRGSAWRGAVQLVNTCASSSVRPQPQARKRARPQGREQGAPASTPAIIPACASGSAPASAPTYEFERRQPTLRVPRRHF